jgi:Lon protease (S16) C-terminal proteolytic domain
VAASAIDLVQNSTAPSLPASGGATPAAPANAAAGWTWRVDNGTPSAYIKKYQSSIKALYIISQSNGSRLGVGNDLIFTADPGTVGYALQLSFTTPIGPQMKLAVDDVIRHLSVIYPTLGGVSRIEFSFEDKYDQHDGGSIGAACGTLLLSAIDNFDIDPHLAMTGDVSADGKVRAIGGISAKLRGAKDADCSLVAIPSDNIDQLIDAFIYGGNSVVTDVQIMGISDLDDAAAVARSDRSANLSSAIAQFTQIQKSIKDSPDYLNSLDCSNKLKAILDLAPNHLSARILLNHLQNQQRRRLSVTASEYYMFAAVQEMLPTLAFHAGDQVQSPDVSNVAIEAGIKSLRHLRPMADLSVQPLIDAWIDFSIALEGQNKWTPDVASKAQAVRDVQAKLNADQDLAQKMLKEGI